MQDGVLYPVINSTNATSWCKPVHSPVDYGSVDIRRTGITVKINHVRVDISTDIILRRTYVVLWKPVRTPL